MRFPRRKPQPKRSAASTAKRTAVTFTAKDLDELARVLGAGQVLLRQSFPVVGRLKAAMTRMGVATNGV
jgi:hypothetical protein